VADHVVDASARKRTVGVAFWPGVAVAAIALAVFVAAGRSAPPTLEERTDAVARTIRCPACGNLSVADATSALALEMRATIRERLASGEPPAQIQDEFVRRYGSWIVLSPGAAGIGLVVWIAPIAGVLIGAGALVVLLRPAARRRRVVARNG
jgi:cytochrome c-type biogenesis protein CcmH/NrfF